MFNEKILLLDTEKNVLLTYQAILQEEGYQVDIATDERSASEKISRETFAVLISELYIKGKKTVNLLKEVKEIHPDIYIIILTASSLNSNSCKEIIDVGVDDYFTKPLSSPALLANIAKGLKRRDLVLKNIQLETKLSTLGQTSHNTYSSNDKVCNKHFFNLKLQNEITRSRRYNHPFSLVIFDIKIPPDNNKHDLSLDKQKISNTISHVLPKITRRTDIITQDNGTFALILVETPISGAKNFSSRLQDEIVKHKIDQEIQMPRELSKILTVAYHSFPDQSDYIQHWTITHNK